MFDVIGPALSFTLACNLDTVLLAAVARGRGQRISLSRAMVLAAVTTLVTGLSLAVGHTAAALWQLGRAERLGGLALLAVGLWCVLDALRGGAGTEETPEEESWWGWCALAAALAVNNAAAGAAAGAMGVDTLWGMGCNFVVTLGALALGRLVGNRLGRRWLAPLGGGLLAVLGLWAVIAP